MDQLRKVPLKIILSIFFSLTLLVFIPDTILASTYYVSKQGNNSNGLSWTTAWNELNQINWSTVKPGDTIEIDGSSTSVTYSTSLSIGSSGTGGSPITISKSQSTGHIGTPLTTGGITVSGNYITVRGLTVKKSSGDAVTVKGSDFITLDSLVVEHPGGRGIKADGYSNPVNNITIKNSRIDTTDESHGYVQADNIYLQYGSNSVIEGNNIANQNGYNFNGYGTSKSHIDLI